MPMIIISSDLKLIDPEDSFFCIKSNDGSILRDDSGLSWRVDLASSAPNLSLVSYVVSRKYR